MTRQVEVKIPPNQNTKYRWSTLVKPAGAVLTIFLVAFLLFRSTVIRPHKPHFILWDVTLYSFNFSDNPILLNTSLEATVTLHNPNTNFGVYYESLDAYATYQGQQFTSRTTTPETYQGHGSTDVWTMSISGTSVPLAPNVGVAVTRDWHDDGLVVIVIMLEGSARWKLGTLAKGNYHITVRCPAYLMIRANGTTISGGNNNVKYELRHKCDVNFSR